MKTKLYCEILEHILSLYQLIVENNPILTGTYLTKYHIMKTITHCEMLYFVLWL